MPQGLYLSEPMPLPRGVTTYQNVTTPRIENGISDIRSRDFNQAVKIQTRELLQFSYFPSIQQSTDAKTTRLIAKDMDDKSPSSNIGEHIDAAPPPVDSTRKSLDTRDVQVATNDVEKEILSSSVTPNAAQTDIVDWEGDDDPAMPMNW
jgi:hypothetical protein